MASPQDKLKSLFVEELRNVKVAPIKKLLIQKIEKTLVDISEIGFHSANTGIKSTFFRFLERALVGMMHQRTWTSY